MGFVPSPGLVCLFGWGVFRHPIFLDLLTPLRAFASLEGLETSVAPLCLLRSACLEIPWGYLLLGDTCSLGGCSSPGEFPDVLKLSVPSALIWTGCFHKPLRCTVASILARLLGMSLASPVLRGCLFAGASLARLLYFQSSDRMRR